MINGELITILKGKTVLLGVTGGIAAYKIANLASMLVKLHADVNVIMTQNATNFINPITFESLTGNKCIVDTFDRNFKFKVEHIALAELADVFMVAPASANVIGKIANGIADDMLTTTLMACKKKKIIAPAMNTNMYENPIVQDNLKRLAHYGMEIIEPANGYLACGTTGAGKLPDEKILLEHILREIAFEKDLSGKTVLVTAGPTREAVDPVRFITNHSTGKMGYAVARIAALRGARVILISGAVSLEPPIFAELVPVVSAEDMYNAVMKYKDEVDIIIKSAAVADYTPVSVSSEKIKKQDGEMSIELKRTKDILKELGQSRRKNQFICGFAMETENLLENAVKKLESKGVDMIVANSLKTEGAGFGTDTNVVTLIENDKITELPLMTKQEVAVQILDKAVNNLQLTNYN